MGHTLQLPHIKNTVTWASQGPAHTHTHTLHNPLEHNGTQTEITNTQLMCVETTNRHLESQFGLTFTFFHSWCCCRPEYVYLVGWGPTGHDSPMATPKCGGPPSGTCAGPGGQPGLNGHTLLCYMDTEACTGHCDPPVEPRQP